MKSKSLAFTDLTKHGTKEQKPANSWCESMLPHATFIIIGETEKAIFGVRPLAVDADTAGVLFGMAPTTLNRHANRHGIKRLPGTNNYSYDALEDLKNRMEASETVDRDDPDGFQVAAKRAGRTGGKRRDHV